MSVVFSATPVSLDLAIGLFWETCFGSVDGFAFVGTSPGLAVGGLAEEVGVGGDSATCAGGGTDATPSGLRGLSWAAGSGLRAERGLRDGIRAGRAMLRICRPGICAGEAVLHWGAGLAANTCTPRVAFNGRRCWGTRWVELAKPTTLKVSKPTGRRAVWGPPSVWSPATWPSGKQGSTLLTGSWTTSGWVGEPSGRGEVLEAGRGLPVCLWITLSAGMVSWTGPAWMGTNVE